ncbi:uncharacterized protein LOC143029244 [Oratosquilla oratoria]|uniref:uncharacterized protein LOC143029244 n=1 Tax=Oratosquilla oratoria TaxID=337810 RepID=UPI003F76BB48
MAGNRTAHDNIMKVIELHKVGKNNREIAKVTGVIEYTVSRLQTTWRAGGEVDTVPLQKHARTNALEISPKALRLVKRVTIQENIQKRLNHSKVKARVKPFVTTKQSRRRVQFGKDHEDWNLGQWLKVLWNDEASFCISESKGPKVWKSPTASACDPRLTMASVEHPPYHMVWVVLDYGGLGILVILLKGQSANSERYINLLEEILGECFAKTG